ncbi:MAG: glucose 1-dehydrogenase [Acidobacteriaceae bacterium]
MTSQLFDLSGQVALVTGASRGLGQCFARALANAGADLIITSRRTQDLSPFVAEIESLGRRAIPLELDVRDQQSIEKMSAAAEEAYGRIHILVNNAGCNVRKPALDVTWDDWNLILDTNLRGSFFVAQQIARRMLPYGYGRIVNIGSVTSVFGYAGLAPYGASRGGIRQLTMSLADDWGKYGITVNCLAPGWFQTEQNKVLYEDKEWVDYIVDRIPLKRPGEPRDLEGAIVFLASEASRYITGQTLLVDGGISTGSTRATVKQAVPSKPDNITGRKTSTS